MHVLLILILNSVQLRVHEMHFFEFLVSIHPSGVAIILLSWWVGLVMLAMRGWGSSAGVVTS